MENWQYRLISEPELLSGCALKHIENLPDRSYCYLMKSRRPSYTEGSVKIE